MLCTINMHIRPDHLMHSNVSFSLVIQQMRNKIYTYIDTIHRYLLKQTLIFSSPAQRSTSSNNYFKTTYFTAFIYRKKEDAVKQGLNILM